ncbi:MAG: arginine--tRNA ligase [Pseudomonadota bacterium]|nr:arginine--tRNA ligase [Pseudomonadota bacterium]
MNVFNIFRDIIKVEIEKISPAVGTDGAPRISVEPPRDPSHGDLSTNAAMVLSKLAGMKPRDLAEPLAAALGNHPDIQAVDVAGPGFVNISLDPAFWRGRIDDILAAGEDYGNSTIGAGLMVNIEYVSANPTGPMHVGHARGAVLGDALAGLLSKAGFDVTREYYINDAGAQTDILARSLHLRYREALGEDVGDIPEGLYPGDYLVPPAAKLAERDGDKWRDLDEPEWLPALRDFAIDEMMDLIREDLAALGIHHALFSSERELMATGAVDDVVAGLEKNDLVYVGVLEPPKGKVPDDWESRPQTLFRSTQFGDDVDRPLKKSDGGWTYFASDIAYHRDKFRRGFDAMIDVWGADHKGYVKRMQSAVTAVSGGKATLDVRICNLVHLFDGGEPVKMSKRAGTFVTLREVVDKVGRDVVRFIMLTRGNEAALEFDLATVVEQSRDNPVFYVQYAHARACSVLRNAAAIFPELPLDDSSLADADYGRLKDPGELALIKLLAGWPRVVETAAEAHEPHRIAYYLSDIAAQFHGQWAKGNTDEKLRYIMADDMELTQARAALVRATAIVVASGLRTMGVEPVEEMR